MQLTNYLTSGGRCLQKLTEKFVFKKVNDLTRWLIFHWDDVILCECALEDLKDYVIGMYVSQFL